MALLWACFDNMMIEYVPATIRERVRTQYSFVEGANMAVNPVRKIDLVVSGYEGQLQIDEIRMNENEGVEEVDPGEIVPGGAGGGAGRCAGGRLSYDHISVLYRKLNVLKDQMEEAARHREILENVNRRRWRLLNNNIQRIALQPIQRVVRRDLGRGEGEQGEGGGQNLPDPNEVDSAATLSPTPKDTLSIVD